MISQRAEIYILPLHDALPIYVSWQKRTTGRMDQWESFPAVFFDSPIWGFGPGSGITTRVKNIEPTNPKAIALPSGDHMLEPERIMGVTPTAAAIVVRKMGRNLRSPASMAASSTGTPSFMRSFV